MSIITRSENATQSDPAAEQVGAEKPSARGTGSELPESLAAATKGQRRRPKPASSAVTEPNKTSVHFNTASPTASTPVPSSRPKKVSKQDTVLELLSQIEGATIDELMDATAWQAHSVRGFLSGTVRKKLKMHLISDVIGNGVRRYRVATTDHAIRTDEAEGQPMTNGSASGQEA